LKHVRLLVDLLSALTSFHDLGLHNSSIQWCRKNIQNQIKTDINFRMWASSCGGPVLPNSLNNSKLSPGKYLSFWLDN